MLTIAFNAADVVVLLVPLGLDWIYVVLPDAFNIIF